MIPVLRTIAGLFDIALAGPLLELASDVRHELRRATWRDVEGRHYAFRGLPVRVREDEHHQRWVRLAHLSKERSPEAPRLRVRVEREIVFPARRERERLGIRPEALDFRTSD